MGLGAVPKGRNAISCLHSLMSPERMASLRKLLFSYKALFHISTFSCGKIALDWLGEGSGRELKSPILHMAPINPIASTSLTSGGGDRYPHPLPISSLRHHRGQLSLAELQGDLVPNLG